ncbi:MAG: acetyl-CoA carboxylase biotin carboxyl carrier protein [candidate division Zixibacteria bacterium]|nr:acetyl-CoA carboxylase biotin carboxyl carrier protein [candidate division Zixibacteria bacterium]
MLPIRYLAGDKKVRERYIKKLIRLVEESDIESLEVSSWGRRVKIVHSNNSSSNGFNRNPVALEAIIKPLPVQAEAETAAEQPASAKTVSNLKAIKSPMVGTFYSSPSPDSDPYVSVNQRINTGQVVCIVEAMKLMNEIESEYGGRIAKVLIENGKPVEFGQELFLVEPD